MLGGSTISAANALQGINSSASMSSSSSSTTMQPSSYNSDRSSIQTGLDVEFASDAASGGFFNSDYKKCAQPHIGPKICKTKRTLKIVSFSFIFIHLRHDDLKQMLDSNKDNLKLEAMKRIIGMVAKVSKHQHTIISTIISSFYLNDFLTNRRC